MASVEGSPSGNDNAPYASVADGNALGMEGILGIAYTQADQVISEFKQQKRLRTGDLARTRNEIVQQFRDEVLPTLGSIEKSPVNQATALIRSAIVVLVSKLLIS
jgi:hypothetical protein